MKKYKYLILASVLLYVFVIVWINKTPAVMADVPSPNTGCEAGQVRFLYADSTGKDMAYHSNERRLEGLTFGVPLCQIIGTRKIYGGVRYTGPAPDIGWICPMSNTQLTSAEIYNPQPDYSCGYYSPLTDG